jgi:hypothetical protein
MVEFKTSGTLGSGLFCLDVLSEGVLVGTIRKRLSTGIFRYYRGVDEGLVARFEDADLERLKQRVRDDCLGRTKDADVR